MIFSLPKIQVFFLLYRVSFWVYTIFFWLTFFFFSSSYFFKTGPKFITIFCFKTLIKNCHCHSSANKAKHISLLDAVFSPLQAELHSTDKTVQSVQAFRQQMLGRGPVRSHKRWSELLGSSPNPCKTNTTASVL